MKAIPLPPHSQVRVMRKDRYRGTKAGVARRLYAERCSPQEIAAALQWEQQQVRQALRRTA